MSDDCEAWFREQILQAVKEADDENITSIFREDVMADMAVQRRVLPSQIGWAADHVPYPADARKWRRDALLIICAATQISGNLCSTIGWFRNERLPVFEGQTAEQLVSDGRTDDVLRYIKALEAGAVG
ncbi:hypothetical protein [Burkholderia cepacia]|uniref:hypothetical protein n=1 Tax=Burkholderia cepacia TaxID=292 RepID=UPI00075A5B12|nr:hypothetical protein [Burkholderia cepacia]KVL12974.1 hypothetical protein WJ46_26485 [Burkholderia cepacia]KVQ26023.1 hypothetical protein WK02_25870 [Burkholderia cepacia]KVZ25654.1 hypothetical protein WL14_10350 [Burkholderia cepacia]